MNTTSQADMNDDGIGNSGVLLIGWYNGGNTIEFLVKADQVAHPSIYRPYKEERQMITVSSAIQKNSEMASSRRSVTSGPGDANAFVKGTGMTADQKAEVAQRKANAAALVAASDKQVFEMKKKLVAGKPRDVSEHGELAVFAVKLFYNYSLLLDRTLCIVWSWALQTAQVVVD